MLRGDRVSGDSFWFMPSMSYLEREMPATRFGTPIVLTFQSLYAEPEPLFPKAIGQLLAAASDPPPGPPFVHQFQHPLPEEVLVEDDDGELVEVERWPLLPYYTITRAPEFTGVLSYLEAL